MRNKALIVCLMVVLSATAQDMQRLAEREIVGTSRYVGLAGAMTAIGGDPSAVQDNPAGLGIYRRQEISTSADFRFDQTQTLIDQKRQTGSLENAVMLPQVSYVIAVGDRNKLSGVIYNNIMFSFARKGSYYRDIVTPSHESEYSLQHVIANNLNNSPYPMSPNDLSEGGRWSNEHLGWLPCLAWDTYLIGNPDSTDLTTWGTLVQPNEKVTSALNIIESGYHNTFAIHYAMNVSNRLYWGLGLNVDWLYRSKTATYQEAFQSGGQSEILSQVSYKAVGVNGTVGVLYHPIQMFRIGASVQTPSLMNMRIRCSGDAKSKNLVDRESYTGQTPVDTYQEPKFSMPMRASIGTAVQFWQYGFLSLQYDYTHWLDMQDIHTLKAGIEGVIAGRYYLDGGYCYESTFAKEDQILPMTYDIMRTDADFQNIKYSQYASLGFGYHGEGYVIGLAYQFRWQKANLYAHELQETPFDVRTNTHRLVLTVEWKSR